MDRQVLLFILSLGCFWLILDEFVGKKYIGQLIEGNLYNGGGATIPTPGPAAPTPFDPKKAAPDTKPGGGSVIG